MIRPSRTTTAPTIGFGAVRPRARTARCSARRIAASGRTVPSIARRAAASTTQVVYQVGAVARVLSHHEARLSDREVHRDEDEQQRAKEIEQLDRRAPAAGDQVGQEPESQVRFQDETAGKAADELLPCQRPGPAGAPPVLVEQ